jgi:membrane protein implicated in regulation of membrane protease activity
VQRDCRPERDGIFGLLYGNKQAGAVFYKEVWTLDFSFLTNPAMIWFLVGLASVLAEFAMPGVVLVFFGVGAWVVALLCLWIDVSVLVQIVVFLVLSIASLVFLRRYFMKPAEGGRPSEDAEDFIGKMAVSQEELTVHGSGKVLFNGALWRAKPEGDPIPKQTHVRIVRQDNLVLIVSPVEKEKEK